MAASEMLRARVDPALAKKVKAWAKEHDTDVSGAIRTALLKLLQEAEAKRRIDQKVEKQLDEWRRMGLFDPPKGIWKAGGFR